jgi:hypothetical protein
MLLAGRECCPCHSALDDCSTRLTLLMNGPQLRSIFFAPEAGVHLLYLDESGHSHDPSSAFFVLAGFSIFERQTHWLDAAMEPIAKRFNNIDSTLVEFHGAPMRAGKDGWHGISPADRVQAVVDVLTLLSNKQLKVKVFASVIEKSLLPIDRILSQSFENVSTQFDNYLAALYQRKNPQRGLVILDKTSYEQKIQSLSVLFKQQGHANGKLRNFAEVPLFLDSKASRLIQMADLIAYWIFRYYQSSDDRGMRLIQPYFHTYGGAQRGLVKQIHPTTEAKLAALQPPAYPFPTATEPARP